MDDRAIAIFDSGLGGLTALSTLRLLLPGENIIFFGDSARAPYGSRKREELIRISLQDLAFVTDFDVKAVLIACGTSSSNAMAELKAASPVPVVGVIDAAARAAAEAAPRGHIGVIATEATIKSGAYGRVVSALAPEAEVLEQACPDFVPLVESGRFGGDPEAERAVARALAPFAEWGTDVLLLGCTHYPLLSREIGACLGDTPLISNSECAARELAALLRETGALSGRGSGQTDFYTSGDASDFAENAGKFLGCALEGRVRHVNRDWTTAPL